MYDAAYKGVHRAPIEKWSLLTPCIFTFRPQKSRRGQPQDNWQLLVAKDSSQNKPAIVLLLLQPHKVRSGCMLPD
jgi:hypothetical protein